MSLNKLNIVAPSNTSVTTSNGAITTPVSPGPTPTATDAALPAVPVASTAKRHTLTADQMAKGREGLKVFQAKQAANKAAKAAGLPLPHPEVVKGKKAAKAKAGGSKKKGTKGQWFRNPTHKAFNFYVRPMATELYAQSTMAGDIAQYAAKLAVQLTGLVLVPLDGVMTIVLKHRESEVYVTLVQTEANVITVTTSTQTVPDSLKRDLALI